MAAARLTLIFMRPLLLSYPQTPTSPAGSTDAGGIVPCQSLLIGFSSSSTTKSSHLLVLFVAVVLRGVRGGWERRGVAEDRFFLWGLDYRGRQNRGGTGCRMWDGSVWPHSCAPTILAHKNTTPPLSTFYFPWRGGPHTKKLLVVGLVDAW